MVDLASFTVTGSIETACTRPAWPSGATTCLVANAYSDSISVIDTATNREVRTIDLGLPIGVPGERKPAYGAGPNSIAVDAKNNIAYVALYNANAIAVVDLNDHSRNPVLGMIPVGYAPSSVVLDTADNALLVANDKGWGTTGNPNPFAGTVSGAPLTPNSVSTEGIHGVHQPDRPQHPPGPWHGQHRSRAELLGPVGDDAAGLPEQPLGSGGKYLLGRRRQPVCQAGRNPGRGSAIRRRSSTSS